MFLCVYFWTLNDTMYVNESLYLSVLAKGCLFQEIYKLLKNEKFEEFFMRPNDRY